MLRQISRRHAAAHAVAHEVDLFHAFFLAQKINCSLNACKGIGKRFGIFRHLPFIARTTRQRGHVQRQGVPAQLLVDRTAQGADHIGIRIKSLAMCQDDGRLGILAF